MRRRARAFPTGASSTPRATSISRRWYLGIEQKHRFNLNATYDFNTGPFSHTFGLYYNAQSGRPYSLLLGSVSATVG